MKKLLLFAVALLFAAPAFSQTTYCTPAINLESSPGTEIDEDYGAVYLNPGNGVMPDQDENYYEETVFFKFKNEFEFDAGITTLDITVESVEITKVTWGVDSDTLLPPGMDFTVVSGNSSDNTANNDSTVPKSALIFTNPDVTNDNTGPYGCVTIFGTLPTVDQAKLAPGDTLLINLTLNITPKDLDPSQFGVSTEADASYKIPYKGDITLGMREDLASSLNMRIAPNPASNDINLKFTTRNTQDMTFDVYDLQGRKMNVNTAGTFQPGDHNVALDVSNLASGMYMVKSVVAGQVYTTKFLKN